MSGLPSGWAETAISAIILPFDSVDPRAVPSAEFRYIDIGSIDNTRQQISSHKTFPGREAPSRARRIVKAGDVLFSTVRTYLKNIAVVPPSLDGALTSTGISVLRPSEAVDGRYLFHWVCSDPFVTAMSKAQDGTMYPAVTDRDVVSASISLPPLAEQRRIVAKLDALMARTARARTDIVRIPTLIATYKKVLLSAAFSGNLTREWRRTKGFPDADKVELGSVASDFTYGSAAKSSRSGMVPVLRMGNIQNGKLDWTDLVYTSDLAEIEKYRLSRGDVLFNRTNSPELVGKTALYNSERPALYAGYLIRIRCSNKLAPAYLTYCLNSPIGRDYCWSVKTDAVSPFISHYFCMIERSCDVVCWLFCRRATLWRRETRELLELFRAAAAAKKWSRWAGG